MSPFSVFFKRSIVLFSVALSVTALNSADACTRALRVDEGQAVMVGRNMDWFEDMKTNIWVYPRGIARVSISDVNPLKWSSKYGSIVASAYKEVVSTDGMNEKGLAAHVLSLGSSNYGTRNEKIPGLSVMLWTQYYLDNFQTVDEAVRYTESGAFQVTPFYMAETGRYVNLHLALEDATGDSAIIEYTGGTLHVYHDRNYTILTNDPTYDGQLENLKQYTGFGGDKPLPGTSDPKDRFVRASYYISHLRKATSENDEVAQVLAVMENAAQPYGITYPKMPVLSQTRWRTVSDLTHRIYYFTSMTSPNLIKSDLRQIDLRAGAPVLKLDLSQTGLSGDVSKLYKPAIMPLPVIVH